MTAPDSWQAEADLLADGSEKLEQLCATTRYRHLFPTGPNMALLFQAYQELDRWRTVHRRSSEKPRQRRRNRRRFFRLLKHAVHDDAIARDRRLLWHYPLPRPQPMLAEPPPIVRRALAEIDADTRLEVEAIVHGHNREPASTTSHRGLQQFREALTNVGLEQHAQIARLHPQYLQFMASPQPTRRAHPIATMLLVKLPLQLMMVLLLLFNVAYLGAYHFFNDERLAGFLTDKISGLIDGELAFGSVHWSPMLLVDLLTGQPHTVHGYELEVWEGYKIDELEKSKRTAYAEHVEVEMVMHEIIPWNRLGVPGLLEIPWVLHFEEIQNHGELWVDVRSYQNEHRDGAWMLSLINAFDTYVDLNPPPELKKLSFQIDHGQLDGLALRLDLEERSGWSTQLEFEQIEIGLDFEGWAPAEYAHLPDSKPTTLPLRYEVSARGAHGNVVITSIHDGPIEVSAVRELEVASGMNYRPIGDLWLRGDIDLGGSPSVFEGRLIDVFGDLRFDFGIGTTDVGPLVEILLPPTLDEEGRDRLMVSARGSPASLKAKGPSDDIVLLAVGQNLTLDLFPEPAWALDEVDVSLSLSLDPRPEIWAGQPLAEPPAPQTGDEPEVDDGQRWIVYLDTLRGSALDGSVRLHRRTGQDHIVLPKDGEPWLISIYLDLIGVNLGQLTPHDPDFSGLLQGSTSGGLQIHRVVLGEEGLDHAEAELKRIDITRDHGPADDNLPRNIRADGEVIWDAVDGLDLRGIRFGVDGGQLRLTGGLDANFEVLAPTSASVRVDNGEAFLRAFGMPRWFDTLALDFSGSGPISNPHGSGSLDISGAGSGALAVDDIRKATLEFQRGTLSLSSPSVQMLGGRGPLSADLVLLAGNGKVLSDPKLRVALRLEDINRDDILGTGIGAQQATIELVLDDGSEEKRPLPLSQLQARGGAYAQTLSFAGVDFRDAEASFAFTREGIQIDRMNLAYHRPISPAQNPGVSVPIGRVAVTGTVGFDDDPKLALDVRAINLPLSALAAAFEVDVPVHGQISEGSQLAVSGTLRRPDIGGQLVLAQLGAAGVPLGGGVLQFSSEDVPYQPADLEQGRVATGAHRQVQVGGSLSGAPSSSGGGSGSEGELDWRIDATVAFGGGADNQIEATVDLRFANLPLDTLLAHPSREAWREQIVGGLNDLVVETRYCPSHEDAQNPLLPACAEVDPNDPRQLAGQAVRVDLRLANLWYRGRRERDTVSVGDPCLERDTTCSVNALSARLDGSHLSLAEPWRIRSGGKQGPELVVDGTFDLTGEDEVEPEERTTGRRCIPGIPDNASLPAGTSAASLVGGLDFSAIAPFIGQMGVDSPIGQLAIELAVSGVVTQPTVTGFVRLPDGQPIELSLADDEVDARGRRRSRPIPIEISKFDLRMAGGTVYLDSSIKIYEEVLRISEINNRPSFLDLAGPCSGRFAVSVAGNLDGALVRRLVPDMVESSGGAIEIRSFHVAGDIARFDTYLAELDAQTQREVAGDLGEINEFGEFSDPYRDDDPFVIREPLFDMLSATFSLERKAIHMTVPDIGEVRLASGLVEIRQCTGARPCPGTTSTGAEATSTRRKRGLAVWIAGRRSAQSKARPSDALTLRVGDRGRADLWGELIISDTFDGIEGATVTAAASSFPLSLADNSGRTQLDAALSSERIQFETDGANGRISGDVLIDRSTWLRDARQGIAVLSFADPNPAPPSQLPAFIRNLELDLRLRTGAPFRIDNNVAKKFEARADLRLGGSVGDPDLNGTIDVERGVIDIDILGGAYDVARGRVQINHDLSQSVVDLSAVRQKQIKVNNQLLTLNLHLSGTLDAIQWECTAPGDTSGALATARGCVDYLIFDAGNTDLAASDVRDSRNSNSLLGTRFLPLAGRLAQVELNEVLEREIPRVEGYIPITTIRVDQIGVVLEAETRPEWGRWGWGRLGLNAQYTRGYPGSVVRDSRSFSGRLEILENAALEAAFGLRTYTNRVLIVDPPNYRSIQFHQRATVPSAR